MKQSEVIKRDNLVIEIIRNHKGEENAITNNEICEYLAKNGYNTKSRSLNGLITKLKMERSLPICYTRWKGYFWAKKTTEILNTINDMQSMINSLQEHIELLKSFIIE